MHMNFSWVENIYLLQMLYEYDDIHVFFPSFSLILAQMSSD